MPKKRKDIDALISTFQLTTSLLAAMHEWRAFIVAATLLILLAFYRHGILIVIGSTGASWWRKCCLQIRKYFTKFSALSWIIGGLELTLVSLVIVFFLRDSMTLTLLHDAFEGTPTPTFVPTATATPMPPTPSLTATSTLAPSPTPTSIPTPTPTPIFHLIQTGENPWCISQKYYHTGALWGLICKANLQFSSPEDCAKNLQKGEALWIPIKPDFPQSPIPDPLPTSWVRGKDYICQPEEGKNLKSPLTSQQ